MAEAHTKIQKIALDQIADYRRRVIGGLHIHLKFAPNPIFRPIVVGGVFAHFKIVADLPLRVSSTAI
jgi:hypothetical protein